MGVQGRGLSQAVIDRVIQLKKDGVPVTAICERMGLSNMSVYNILSKKRGKNANSHA